MAQTEMRYEARALGFIAPADFEVSADNVEAYTASNDHVMLSISSFQDENISSKNLGQAVLAIANEMDYEELGVAEKLEFEDFWGYLIKTQNDGGHGIVLLLLEKESQMDLTWVVISYDDGYLHRALDIAKSFFRL